MTYSGSNAPIAVTVSNGSDVDQEWSPDLDADDLRELQAAEDDPSKVISRMPRESVRLGYFSTICLIFNRMIGTGIFNSASVIFTNTQSIGISMILFGSGGVIALAGVMLYIEFGLTIPRWPFGANGEKVSTPRSGDNLNYFNYLLKKPTFLATCLFGITFMVLENTAANSVSMAQNLLDAAHAQQTPGRIIGIALAANTLACLLHTISRKWGIILNNVLGIVKFLILLFIFIIGLIWIDRNVANDNLGVKTSFNTRNSPRLPYRYAEAMVYVIYPYGAFHQINYVISELREPRKTFPRASFYGVLTVAIIYTAVMLSYAAIIPKKELFTAGGIDVGARFFQLTIGHAITNPKHLQTFFSTLKAISAMGNIIVVTFTTARVKQEIAKEGILPYSLFFAQSYDFSLSRLFGKSSPKADITSMYSEKTPAAALALHWALTTVMVIVPIVIIKPIPYSATPAQSFLAAVFAYDIDIVCFTALSFGLLYLRFSPNHHWAEKSQFKYPAMSIACALIVFVGCLFPLIFVWVPDPAYPKMSRTSNLLPWFTSWVAAICLVTLSFVYWIIFRVYVSLRSAREGTTLHVKREPKFKHDSDGLTQVLEIVSLEWKREIGLRLDEIMETDDGYLSNTVSPALRSVARLQYYGGVKDRSSTGISEDSVRGNGNANGVYDHPPIRRKPVRYELAVAEHDED